MRVGQVSGRIWRTGIRDQLYRPENFWELFSPEDWELGVPAVTVASAAANEQAQTRVAMQTEASEESSAERQRCKYQKAERSPSFAHCQHGLPFQERDLILPVGEATPPC